MLKKIAVEVALNTEMDEHSGYEKHKSPNKLKPLAIARRECLVQVKA